MSNEKPKITCLPNGPYLLKNDAASPVFMCLQKADGDTVETASGVALCRCGGSSNKPYCDGTHTRIGFTDEKLADDTLNKRESYIGTRITIHDNRAICAHAGYCTDNLSGVFRMGEEPWIDPNGADANEIVKLIEQCPSGALSYSIDDVEHRDQNRDAGITVLKDGPYAVSGAIDLVDQPLGDGASAEHYTLCRCGASKNKPYCDGSHWDAGFKDEVN
jgi:CDGSH-type Zn-finger protein